ncbi:biogenesis of lysosome-related organelles complex 1 subunit 6 isoform X2 [Diachasma alloeum]|nr:biogenesis of lysosome-related organelles complex 1 subunit 6 isoform X2 [Diachasma alloeum]XP_015120805.1 biogenesis of lysosome-related organelles complex 1 subunit 6 isoform X2 [Diachasma alloeum]XP_015120806.1 biogenesis of lysosome-related organelles complex 1 subunit 6 isoform X2 [Diachasma alloeum]
MMMEIGEAAAAEVQPNLSEIEPLVTIAANGGALAEGILQAYQPPLEQIKNELEELLKKQDNLIGKMQFENKQLVETAEDGQCCAMYATIKTYQDKLFHIKKEMGSIHDRTMKLKKRAVRLQQIKQKGASTVEQRHEEVSRREQESIRESPST